MSNDNVSALDYNEYYTEPGAEQTFDRVEYVPSNAYGTEERELNLPYLNESYNGTANETLAPHPYFLWEVVLITAVTLPVIVAIIFGNALVCIVIHKDRQLKTVQNWFIASLAIADLLVGLTIMPFTLANEVLGYWVFGAVVCDLWLAADVLLCTSSILHLCLISLDRYWSITQAVDYVRKRTAKRAILMIATVWVLSAVVSLPPLIGWKGPRDTSMYPTCSISEEMGYVVYSCMGSFYIPLCVMITVYFRIYVAARKRAHRNIQKPVNHVTENNERSSFNSLCSWCRCKDKAKKHGEVRELTCFNKPPSTDSGTEGKNSDSEFSEYSSKETKRTGEMKATYEIHNLLEDHRFQTAPKTSEIEENDSSDVYGCNLTESLTDNGFKQVFSNDTARKIERLENLEASSNAKDAHLCPLPKKASLKKNAEPKTIIERVSISRTPSKSQRSEAEKHKRRIARARERRATLVLGIIMAAFTVCWFPFFTIYMIATVWSLVISDPIFKFFFWLGYCNSAFNPIIYTIFNRDFKNAFYKLLCNRTLKGN